MSFNKFSKAVEGANDRIVLKEASKTSRKGVARIRDRIVFGRVSWGEALTYLAIIQSTVIFMALIPAAIETMNGMLTMMGIDFQFPIGVASLAAVVFIVAVFIFGLIAVRHIGTYRSSLELGTKMNPGILLLWEQNTEILDRLNKLEGKDGEKDINNRE